MRRRTFVGSLGGAVLLTPFVARAQRHAVIGFLHGGSSASSAAQTTAFRAALGLSGFTEGQTIIIEYRWAEGHYDRLPALAADLLKSPLDVVFTGGGPVVALAAKAATKIVPIVFVTGDDPVRYGLVESLARPGGNITGVVFFQVALGAKRLELLREMLPAAKAIGYLVNSTNPESEQESKEVEAAARSFGLELHMVRANTDNGIDAAFADLRERKITALMMGSDTYLFSRRGQIAALAARHTIAVIATGREYVEAGNLMSYGTSIPDAFRQAGLYVGQILKGAKPAELPVTQPTKFDLAINLTTAKLLGITVPPSLLARADEVIE
jgi:putative ABC transport system substrate-binding protein